MSKRDFIPLDMLRQLELEMQRFSDEAMRSVLFHPRVDMYETEDALLIKMEIAGVQPEKLNITLAADDRSLTLSGARAEPPQERQGRIRCYQLEVYFGAFERTVELPPGLAYDRENIAASYRDGFLTVSLPKRRPAPPEKRIIRITGE